MSNLILQTQEDNQPEPIETDRIPPPAVEPPLVAAPQVSMEDFQGALSNEMTPPTAMEEPFSLEAPDSPTIVPEIKVDPTLNRPNPLETGLQQTIDSRLAETTQDIQRGVTPNPVYDPPPLYEGQAESYRERLRENDELVKTATERVYRPVEALAPQPLPAQMTGGYVPTATNKPGQVERSAVFDFNPFGALAAFFSGKSATELGEDAKHIRFGEYGQGAIGGVSYALGATTGIAQGIAQDVARTAAATIEGLKDFRNFGAAFSQTMMFTSPLQMGQKAGVVRMTGNGPTDSFLTSLRNGSWLGRSLLGGNQTAQTKREERDSIGTVVNPLSLQRGDSKANEQSLPNRALSGAVGLVGGLLSRVPLVNQVITPKAVDTAVKGTKQMDVVGAAGNVLIDIVSGGIVESVIEQPFKKAAKAAGRVSRAKPGTKVTVEDVAPRRAATRKTTTKPPAPDTQIQSPTTQIQRQPAQDAPQGVSPKTVIQREGTVLQDASQRLPEASGATSVPAPKPPVVPGVSKPVTRLIDPQELAEVQARVTKEYRQTLPSSLVKGTQPTTLKHLSLTNDVINLSKVVREAEVDYQRITGILKAKELTDLRPVSLLDEADTFERLRPDVPEFTPQPQRVVSEVTAPFYHGTRVPGLDVKRIDPIAGGGANEYGAGLYLSRNKREAIDNALKDASDNLPPVAGRNFEAPYVKGIEIRSDEGILKATDILNEAILNDLSGAIGRAIGRIDSELSMGKLKPVNTVQGTYDEIERLLNKAYGEYGQAVPEFTRHEVFREVNETLRSYGIRGIDDGDMRVLFDTQALIELGDEYLEAAEDAVEMAVGRFNATSEALARNPRNPILREEFEAAKIQLLSAAQDVAEATRSELRDKLRSTLDDLDATEQVLREESEQASEQRLRKIIAQQRKTDENHINETFNFRTRGDNPCL